MVDIGNSNVQIVCPSIEELSVVNNVVKCSEIGCNSTFNCFSNLTMHLIKHHKKKDDSLKKKETEVKFCCPVGKCVYTIGGEKFFKKLKYLKQHYIKVHNEKSIPCAKCQKCFPTESIMKQHLKICGSVFVCSCGWTYSTKEAILTHCKRKGHIYSNKIEPSEKVHVGKVIEEVSEQINKKIDGPVPIYPKLSVPYVAAVALIELSTTSTSTKAVNKQVQTDDVENWSKLNKRVINQGKNERKHKNSQQTQTISKCKKISAETQTNPDYKHVKYRKNTPRKRKKSMETQTHKRIKMNKTSWKKILVNTEDANTSLAEETKKDSYFNSEIFDDSLSNSLSNDRIPSNNDRSSIKTELNLLNTIDDESSTTTWFDKNSLKKNLISLNAGQSFITTIKNEDFNQSQELNLFKDKSRTSMNVKDRMLVENSNMFDIETQTNLLDCEEDTCSTTETQTTEDFDSLLYSHMYTQTADDVDNLFDFDFVDIETQTAWPDLDDCEYLSS